MTESDTTRSENSEFGDQRRRWWFQPELAFIVVLVLGIYACRLTAIPVIGEEGRWARGAVQMIETGDWIVPRQQGQVFPERPPMSSWMMAIVGKVRGSVDAVAVRLPSVLAVLVTSLLIYGYSRCFISRFGALAAAIVFATFGQVLQLGRLGESESLFTLFVSASLIIWHWGYVRSWPSWLVWLLGYVLMVCAALVKGPQAPVYFVAVTSIFLAVKRDWRFLLSWSHATGLAVGLAVIAAWQIPFYLATDVSSSLAVWGGLAGDRFSLNGFFAHLMSYPVETFGCLLPWSPLLMVLVNRRFRESIQDAKPLVTFISIALLVTYPTVWFASGARGRYYMPLYPCVAILLGVIIERCLIVGAKKWERHSWYRFVIGCATVGVIAGISVGTTGSVITIRNNPLNALSPQFAVGYGIIAVALAALLVWSCFKHEVMRAYASLVALSVIFGLSYTGIVVSIEADRLNDLGPVVANIKQQLPNPQKLVSLGPVDFRFCYHFEDQIKELPWPATIEELPADTEYVCFDRHPSDTDSIRITGRGRTWRRSAARFPFEWEEVATVCCERRIRQSPQPVVVIAKIIKPTPTIVSKKIANETSRH